MFFIKHLHCFSSNIFIVFFKKCSLISSKSFIVFHQNVFMIFGVFINHGEKVFMVFSRKWWKCSRIIHCFLHIHQRKCSIMKRKHHIFWVKLLRFYLFLISLWNDCRKFCKVICCSSVNSREFFYVHSTLQRSEFNIIPLLHRYKRERSAKHSERCNVAWFQKDSYELTELHHITLRNFLQLIH